MKQQRGVALLEVLIALVISSVGLLGMALLQVNAMQHTHQGVMHSNSTYLLSDMADRIRANSEVADSGDYDLAFGAAVAAGKNCESVVCTEAEMADYDLEQWELYLQRVLPGGDGFVSVSAGLATIRIQYDDNRDESDTAQYELKAAL